MSSRRLFAAALVCALPFAAIAAETPEAPAAETVKWVIPWKAGMSHKYAMEDIETETKAGVRTHDRTRSTGIVRITQASTEGFVQAWSDEAGSSSYEVLEGDKAFEAAMQKVIQDMAGVVVEVDLDKAGNYTRVRNLDDVLPRLRKAMLPVAQAGVDAQVAKIADPEKREKARKDATAQIARSIDTLLPPAVLETMLTRDIQTFNGFFGIDLEPDMAYELETALPNPFGGEPFPAKLTLSLSISKDDPDDIFVVFDQAIDPTGAAKAVEALVKKLGGDDASREVKAALEGFSIVDEGLFVVHRPTGVIEMLETTRTTKSANGEKVERHRMRLLDGEHEHVWKDEEALENAEDTAAAE